MNPHENSGQAVTAEPAEIPQESGGFSSMIRFLLVVGLILIGAVALVRWKGHRSASSKIETPAPQTVAVQPGTVTSTPVAPSPTATPVSQDSGTPNKQVGRDPALSSNELAAIYAKVTTSIDEERSGRRR